MPFCQNCRTEYREGFTTCADCGAPLVNTLPEAPAEVKTTAYAEDPLVAVYDAKDETQAVLVKQVLQEANIPVVEKEYHARGALGSVYDLGFISPQTYARLFTFASRAETAKKIIADFLAAYEQGDLAVPE